MNRIVDLNGWICEKLGAHVKCLSIECENGRVEEDPKGINT